MDTHIVTREQLIDEVSELRRRIGELEASRADRDKVRQRLEEQAKLQQIFLDALPPVAMLLRPGTREIVACNKAGKEFGVAPGKTCFETWGQSDKPCPWCLAENAWTEGEPQHLRIWGAGRLWDAHWIPVSDKLCLHYAYDITEETLTEEALRKSEEHYRDLVEATENLVTQVDSEGRFLFVNHMAEKFFGLSPEECVGLSAFEFVHPDDRPRTREAFRQWRRERPESISIENRQVSRTGEVRDMLWTSKMRFDGEGNLLSINGIARDITEGKRAQEQERDLAKFPSENPNPVLRISRDGAILYSNDAASPLLKTWGCDAGESLSGTWLDVVRESLDSGARRQAETKCDGGFLSLTFAPVADSDYVNVYALDITEHKWAEQALQKSEERYRTLVERNPYGIQEIDSRGTIVFANEAHHKMYGYEQGQGLTGRSITEFLARDSQRRDLPGYLAMLVEDQPPPTPYCQVILTAQGKERGFEVVWDYLRDADGHVTGFISVLTDVTDRKRAEERLRFLGLITEQISDVVIATDLEYRITYVNRTVQDLYGYSREEVLGRSPDILNAEPDAERIQNDIYQAVSSGRVWRGEHSNRRKDGSTFPCGMVIFPLADEQGNVFAYASIQRDVTERRRAEEERRKLEAQMQHAQKLESLGVLAGGIAHDFNNLLAVIQGNADLAMLDASDEPAVRVSLDEIRKASTRAAELTHQMLAYSGRGKFVVEPVDLSRVVEDMAHLLGVSISKKITMEYDLGGNLPAVEADATQIRQVVMNLITNASEAIDDQVGTITLTTGAMEADRAFLAEAYFDDQLPEGRYTFFQVSDTGCGMGQEVRARLFDPFFSTKFTGRGLGLTAVLGIVRAHHGAIRIDSEVGKGTMFRVLFPCGRPGAEDAAAAAEAAESPATWRGSGTVLVVDDDEAVRAMAGRMLGQAGFAALTACNGREAVEVFGEHAEEVAAVLLDLSMPEMGGEETFDAIRTIRPDVPVLLCSGYTEEDAAARFSEKGLSGFLHKPFEFEAMISHLRRILAPGA